MISKAWATIRTAINFLPLFRPFIIKLQTGSVNPLSIPCVSPYPTHALTSLSTMGIRPLANCFLAYRPAVWAIHPKIHNQPFCPPSAFPSSRLTQVDGVLNVDVVDQGDVLDFNTIGGRQDKSVIDSSFVDPVVRVGHSSSAHRLMRSFSSIEPCPFLRRPLSLLPFP